MSLPKVLIIGPSFNNDTGGGITLTNLFSGWDRDKIAVACSGYFLLNNMDTSVCNTYYQLGHKEIKWVFPLNFLRRKYFSGVVKFDEKENQNLTTKRSGFRIKVIMNYFHPLMNFFGLSHSITKIQLSGEFCKWLDEFNPDVIYAQASSRLGIRFCSLVHSYLKKPLVFHMMDDWPATITVQGLLRKRWYKKIDHEFRELLDRANVLMSISDQMAEEYEKRYGKKFVTFHNPINIEFWKKYQKNNYELTNSPTILYAGRIGLGIDDSLKLVAKAVQMLNEDLKLSAKFVIQANEKPAWTDNYSCIEHKSFVPYTDLPRVFSEADFLIIPYDFSTKALRFIKYSMPTKAPEYMISGTPIIIFAPNETALVKYAVEFDWAAVITENKVNDLFKAIKYMIQDETVRGRIAKKAKIIAEENHSSVKVANNFKEMISSVSAKR